MFIKTSFEETANELRALGFQELPKESSFFVFINNPNATFSDNDLKDKNIIYTNKICM